MDTPLAKTMVTFWSKIFILKPFFQDEDHLYANFLIFILTIYRKCCPFPVLRFWHTYAHSHLNRGSKNTNWRMKNVHLLLKNVHLKLNYQDEGRLNASCFVATSFPRLRSLVFKFFVGILTIYPKCHRFHFFSKDIGMYIPILTRIQNGHISHLKYSTFFVKNVLFQTSVP